MVTATLENEGRCFTVTAIRPELDLTCVEVGLSTSEADPIVPKPIAQPRILGA